jgi:hypothetical protein
MQLTTSQTVPATTNQPSQTADRQVQPVTPAPVPLDLCELQSVAGGVTQSPGGSW